MRICSFFLKGERQDRLRAGVVADSRVHEIGGGPTVSALLLSGSGLRGHEGGGPGHPLESVVLGAPLPRPGKIIAAIVNTQRMLGGEDVKLDRPRLDTKAPSAVIGPGDTVVAPPTGIRPEVELAAVVGRRISRASEPEAWESFAGFTVLNDVTAPADSKQDAYEAYRRDRSTGTIRKSTMRGPLFRSKNHDTFCPMGPWILTSDESIDWAHLKMTAKFDGELVQEGSTAEYIFSPARIASYVSGFLTLEPGDVVSCGSVGWTPKALGGLDVTEFVLPVRPGAMELEIEGIGKLVNPVAVGPA